MQCNKCLQEKDCNSFYKDRRGFYLKICNICKSNRAKKWRKDNPHFSKNYYSANKESILKKVKKHRELNKEVFNEYQNKYQRDRYSKDINFKLKKRLRNRLYLALKSNQKKGSAIKDLGCSIDELKVHLESQFKPGMTWDNYGIKWEIDHVQALCLFNLTNREQFLIACNFKNLKPLFKEEHLEKSNLDREAHRANK